ncbi:hypothetical protein BUY98_14345, partial [Staphylococcus gallinarum]
MCIIQIIRIIKLSFNKRVNIETIKQENTSFIKEDIDIEKIIQRVNKNKKKYGFESNIEDK